ncbi:MAG: pilus assembly PilX N-terminal domain-containing protein, partial [Candidatus Eremiobacterota bacterium]
MSRRRGLALVSVLLMGAVLLVMVLALYKSVHGELFLSKNQHDQVVALNAAEAGLADAITVMEITPGWALGFTDKPLPGGQGAYSVTFWDGTGTPGELDSINNLGGLAAVASYYGPVPPNSALILSVGKKGGAVRRVGGLVRGGLSEVDTGLQASGLLQMRGNLKVDGFESLETSVPLNVEIHSAKTGAGTMVSWDKLTPTDKALVQGKVSSAGSSADRILFNGSNVAGTTPDYSVLSFDNVPPRSVPPVDIQTAIDAKSGSPGSPLPASGPVTLNGGDHYYNGDQSIQGDLVLQNGAKIYVNGNLSVNGSVSGEGAVLVAGQTDLRGDASVDATDANYVALLSRGSVVLRGFDGTAFLDSLAAGEPADPG